jgi:hypothetical protein
MTFYSDGFIRGFHFFKIFDRNLVDASLTSIEGETLLSAGISFSKETPILISVSLFKVTFFIAFLDKIISETNESGD